MAAINTSFYKGKRIITLSTKGGVGKTTDSLHIGYQLKKKHGLTFQYIDADVQESGTNHCVSRENLLSDCLGQTNSERARPIPSDIVRFVKRHFKDTSPYVLPNVIKKKGFSLHIKELSGFYDGFIIDTQGADSTGGREALVNADIVIVPVNPSGLVISELHKVIEMVMLAQPLNENVRVYIVFNRVVASAKKIAREHIDCVNVIINNYLEKNHGVTKEQARIHVCETVITERQEIYNNVDVGLNAFELSKGKSRDAEIQFDTLLDEIEYLYDLVESQKEVA